MEWLGRLEILEEDRVVKRCITRKILEHKRKKDGLRRQWRKVVAEDLKMKQTDNWITKAKDRSLWQKITKLWV